MFKYEQPNIMPQEFPEKTRGLFSPGSSIITAMQRDVDLAREILLEMECRDSTTEPVQRISIEGYTGEQVSHHVKLLCDAGYLDGHNASSSTRIHWLAKSLTDVGHKFLELSRVDSRWSEAKQIVIESGGPVSFESIKEVLLRMANGTPGTANPS